MNKPTSLEKHLQEILLKGDFEQLVPFQSEASWSKISPNERNLLANLFISEGEYYLQKKDPKAMDSFNVASKISPEDFNLFFRQANALSMAQDDTACLTAACKAVELALTWNPLLFDGWVLWGNLLTRLGVLFDEVTLFHQADQKFKLAIESSPSLDNKKLGHLLWQWGLCWQQQGKISGEAYDSHTALEKFRQAADLGFANVEFWNDYGDSTTTLSRLLGGKDLLLKATELYQNAVELAPEHPSSWCSLACSLQRLFEFTNEASYFQLAQEGFVKAAELNSNDFDIWLNWGMLLSELGKRKQDANMLELSIEKFSKAALCNPQHSILLGHWGEALLVWGSLCDRVDLLKEAESKLIKSLEIDPESVDTWYLYGTCLSELGRYFSDEAFYYQAIEKFEYALTLSPQNPLLWHGSALAHFAIGDMCGDIATLEVASSQCTRVVEYSNGKVPPQFWNDWGVVFMKLSEITNSQQHVQNAIDKFEMALGLRLPEEERLNRDPEWWYNYGCALDFLGDHTEDPRDHEKAIHILTQVLEHDTSSPHVRYNLALSWLHLGELTDDGDCFFKALEHFQILLQENREDESGWNDWGLTLINLAQLVNDPAHPEKTKELYDHAESKFNHAVALGSTQALYNLACLHSLMGNFSAAMHFIEKSEKAGVLPAIDDMLYDDWLDGLRQTSDFRHFLAQLKGRSS
jgi:tetratricopeptide (TPR) repeat protein